MKSTTVHKHLPATSLASLKAATHTPSESASHNRHHHTSYRNNSASSRDSIKLRPSDANNNDNSSLLSVTGTTTAATTKTPTPTAPNRSKNIEKYSLRQRQKRAFAVPSCAAAVSAMSVTLKSTTPLNNSISDGSGSRSCFSSGIKRTNNISSTLHSSNSKEKPKSKAAPLSKYRRKTANARERTRMREINTAFETLRRCVPHSLTGDESTSSNEKLTKITTLRLAMKYIRTLSEALINPSFQEDFLLECRNNGDHRFSTAGWVQSNITPESRKDETHSDSSVTTPTNIQSRPKTRKTKLQPSKASTKRQRAKTKSQNTLSSYVASSPTYSSSLSSSSSSAYASMSTSPLLADSYSMTDLSNMILESDGESLHLSEPCLSPLNKSYYLGMRSVDETESAIQSSPVGAAFDNPLELSLRLLEPPIDSLEFSTDQQPLTCISPLATLETFNPFGDLLHTEFSEHSSLDLFLT